MASTRSSGSRRGKRRASHSSTSALTAPPGSPAIGPGIPAAFTDQFFPRRRSKHRDASSAPARDAFTDALRLNAAVGAAVVVAMIAATAVLLRGSAGGVEGGEQPDPESEAVIASRGK
jgi:hypothetical protein